MKKKRIMTDKDELIDAIKPKIALKPGSYDALAKEIQDFEYCDEFFFCPRCYNNFIIKDSKFCSECGVKLKFNLEIGA